MNIWMPCVTFGVSHCANQFANHSHAFVSRGEQTFLYPDTSPCKIAIQGPPNDENEESCKCGEAEYPAARLWSS
jgi:hypothetical protein